MLGKLTDQGVHRDDVSFLELAVVLRILLDCVVGKMDVDLVHLAV